VKRLASNPVKVAPFEYYLDLVLIEDAFGVGVEKGDQLFLGLIDLGIARVLLVVWADVKKVVHAERVYQCRPDEAA